MCYQMQPNKSLQRTYDPVVPKEPQRLLGHIVL